MNFLKLCAPENVAPVQELISGVINDDTVYARQPLELRNQRTYAVKSGINGLLDVARQTYKEATEDAYQHCTELSREFKYNFNSTITTDVLKMNTIFGLTLNTKTRDTSI